MKSTFFLALVVLLSWPLSSFADSNTHEFTLDNGLTVLVRENHQAPVVTVMLWYKVGSIDEPAGETGISHVLEHMMFKGSKHLKPGAFSSTVSEYGGSENAFTSYDYTAYYQQYAANRLPLALELEAERMHNLVIDPKQFASELKVVKEERRMRVLDNPNAYAWERFAAIARPGTGYAHPTIGWLNDLDSITPSKLRAWYKQYYQPANASLVIVGDVTLDKAKQLVKRYFADIPSQGKPWHAAGALQPPAGQRLITLHLPVKVPTLYMAFNVPTLGNAKTHNSFYALSMLAGVLDGGASARLPSRLVRHQRLLAGVSASYGGSGRGGGLFTLSATPNPKVSLQQAQSALLKQLTQLKNQPPSKAEMQRVRAQVLAGDVYGKDSNMGQAMTLGRLLTVGLPWQLADNFADNLAKVTPEDVSQAAAKWLTKSRRSIAHVLPAPANQPETNNE